MRSSACRGAGQRASARAVDESARHLPLRCTQHCRNDDCPKCLPNLSTASTQSPQPRPVAGRADRRVARNLAAAAAGSSSAAAAAAAAAAPPLVKVCGVTNAADAEVAVAAGADFIGAGPGRVALTTRTA